MNTTKNTENLVRVELKKPENFKIIVETLTRIGIHASDNILHQICFILHKRGQYYITHWKELLALDGSFSEIFETELAQRNAIVQLLESWEMIDVVNPQQIEEPKPSMNGLRIIRYQDKGNWQTIPLYKIGHKK